VTLDTSNDQMRVCVFLSEVKAQRLAVRIRQKSHVGSISVAFDRLLGRRLPPILRGKRPRRLRLKHAGLAPAAMNGPALEKLLAVVPPVLIAKTREWLVNAFTDFLKTSSQKFLAASEDPADGVTLTFTIEQAPGLKELGPVLSGKGTTGAVETAVAQGRQPSVRVDAVSGHRCA
jgi:hypothetical protein